MDGSETLWVCRIHYAEPNGAVSAAQIWTASSFKTRGDEGRSAFYLTSADEKTLGSHGGRGERSGTPIADRCLARPFVLGKRTGVQGCTENGGRVVNRPTPERTFTGATKRVSNPSLQICPLPSSVEERSAYVTDETVRSR